MAFTYNLGSADPAIVAISEVRFQIGDTVEDAGVLPNGGNLQDDEVTLLITRETTILAASAAAMEIIALRYANAADVASGDVKKAQSQISKAWAARADKLRAQIGSTPGGAAQTSVVAYQSVRVDGYSELGER